MTYVEIYLYFINIIIWFNFILSEIYIYQIKLGRREKKGKQDKKKQLKKLDEWLRLLKG